jgi:hypothetical protein
MLTGWVLVVVLTNGLTTSTITTFPGFATEAECNQVASQSVASKDRWTCFKSNR